MKEVINRVLSLMIKYRDVRVLSLLIEIILKHYRVSMSILPLTFGPIVQQILLTYTSFVRELHVVIDGLVGIQGCFGSCIISLSVVIKMWG